MSRHGRPHLQRASTSGSLHGDQVIRSSLDPRSSRSRHQVGLEDLEIRRVSRESAHQRSTSANPTSPDGLPYACPYAKYDPTTYSHSHKNISSEHEYRNCSTGYWTSVARLKQHLYRTHDRSTRCCERCWQNFANDDYLRRHLEAKTCKVLPMPEEKMDAEQHQAIRERVQGKPVESWYKIYRILFPDEEEMPLSPYAEWVTGEDLRKCFQLLINSLPRLLYQAALSEQPQARGIPPTRTTKFPTTADWIQQALAHCQKEFGQATGLSHVFASGTTSPTGSAAGSSSERGTVSASRIRSNPEQPPHRHSQMPSSSTQRSHRMQEEEDDDDEDSDSSSNTEMSVDPPASQVSRHGLPQRFAQPGRGGYPVTTTVPYTSTAAYTAITAPPTDEDLLHARYIQEELYPTYGMGSVPEDEWSS